MMQHVPAHRPTKRTHPPICPVCTAIVREIASFASGQCWLAQTTIGERVGRSPRAIRTHLRALEANNILRTQRRGLTFTNRYALVSHPRPATRCRSSAAKTTDNIVPDSVTNDSKKQAPASAPTRDALPNSAPMTIDSSKIAGRLIAAGVSPRRAHDLSSTFAHQHIEQQLAWLPYRQPTNPGAVLATAIVESFPEPKAAKLARTQHEATTAKRARTLAAQTQAASLESQRMRDLRDIDRARATLPSPTLLRLQHEAYAETDAAFFRAIKRSSVAFRAATNAALDRKLLAAIRTPPDQTPKADWTPGRLNTELAAASSSSPAALNSELPAWATPHNRLHTHRNAIGLRPSSPQKAIAEPLRGLIVESFSAYLRSHTKNSPAPTPHTATQLASSSPIPTP